MKTIRALVFAVLLASAAIVSAQDPASSLEQAKDKLARGIYKGALKAAREAIQGFTDVIAEEPEDKDAPHSLFIARKMEIDVLLATGEYDEAARLALSHAESEANGMRTRAYLVAAAASMRIRGRLDDAAKAVSKALESDGNDLWARLEHGYCLLESGKRAEAMEAFDWFVDLWGTLDRAPDADTTETAALAAIELGVENQDLYLDAQRMLEKLEKDNPERQDARVALSRLYVDRYAPNFAKPALASLLKENPNHPGARAVSALVAASQWNNAAAAEECGRALAVNPNHPFALKVKAMIAMADEGWAAAVESLNKAIEVNPSDVEALSMLAACRYMQGDSKGYAEIEAKVAGLRPEYGDFYHTVAGSVSQSRRIEEAIALERKAVETSPKLWAAWFGLGTYLSRQGDFDEAKKALEKGFAGDSYNRMAKNLLTLFDDYEHFVPRTSKNFRMLFHKSEEAVMSRYNAPLLEEAWVKLTEKYGFEPVSPVNYEMFHRHDDFAVRTLGFPGLGASGACFGPLITMASPHAMPFAGHNWASTAWHEFAHVVTVQLSKGRVPRWFTEGLSVYEERCGRQHWQRPMHRLLIGRLKAGGLTPIKDLNAQFTRGNVLLAYFHASWVVDYVVERGGFGKIVEMLKAYGRDLDDAGVIKEVFSEDLDAFDKGFKEWLAKRFDYKMSPIWSEEERRALRIELEKDPKNPALLVKYARACLQNGKIADAEINAGQALDLAPDDYEAPSILGELMLMKGRPEAAKKYFEQALARGGKDYNVLLRLAAFAEKEGEIQKSAELYEAARDAFPDYTDQGDTPYLKLRVIYGRLGRHEDSLKMLEEYLKREETEIPLRLEIAAIYKRAGKADLLERVLREILEVWPFTLPDKIFPEGPFDVHLELGRLYLARGAAAEALTEAEVALLEMQFGQKKPTKADEINARLFLAECLVANGKKSAAEGQLEEILEYLDPENAKAKEMLEHLKKQ